MVTSITTIRSFCKNPHNRLLCLIVLAGGIVRFWGIGWGLPYRIGGDPGEFVEAALRLIANPASYLDCIVGSRIYPPMYHYFLTPFFAAFLGLVFLKQLFITLSFGESASFMPLFVYNNLWVFTLIARIVTALLGTSTIVLVYTLAGKICSNKKAALAAAAIYSFLFGDVFFAHINVSHAFLTFLVVAAFIYFMKLTKCSSYKNYVFCALLCSMVVSTKFTYWPIFAVFLVTHYFYVSEQSYKNKFINGKLFLFGIVVVMTLIALIPPIFHSPLSFLKQMTQYSTLFRKGQIGLNNFFGAYIFDNRPKFNCRMLTNSFWGGMGILPFVLSIFGFFYSFIRRDKSLLLTIFVVMMYLYMESYPLKGIKYLVPIFPLLTILGAKFLVEMTDKSRLSNLSLLTLVGLILLFPILKVVRYNRMISGTHTWIAARSWIERNILENTTILGTPYSPPLELSRHDLNWLRKRIPATINTDIFRESFKQKKSPEYNYTQINPSDIGTCVTIEEDRIAFNSPLGGERIEPAFLILDSYTTRKVQHKDVSKWDPEICAKWDQFLAYINSHFKLVKSFLYSHDGLFGPDIHIYQIPKDCFLSSRTSQNSPFFKRVPEKNAYWIFTL